MGVFLLLAWPAAARTAPTRPQTVPPEMVKDPADFDNCARVALRQSPFFTKSALEIEVRRLDEKDSKSDFFPSLKCTTRYYLVQPNDPNVTDPLNYSVAVTTGDYNPIFAYLSLKVTRAITQIATLGHMKAMAAGLERLGKAFLELHALENLIKLKGQSLELTRESVRYAKERQKLGELTPMEVQIANQEAEVAAAELEAMKASQGSLRHAIRDFMGLKADQSLRLDVSSARRQVLGDFQAKKASLQEAEERSFDVRIKRMTKELQTYNVSLAKMKFLPSLNLSLQSPDPMTLTNARGTFFSVGLSFPIFDGFKRLRNIDRQKTVLGQYASEQEVKTSELSQKWGEAEEKLNNAAAALRVAQAQADLAKLKETQGETLYRSAEKDFSILMAGRQARVKAQTEAVKQGLDYDLAVLELRHLSGDLVYHYAHENQFKK